MKKFAATAIAGAMLAAVPAVAHEGHAGGHAAVTDDFLTIGGPKRLVARATLKVPIRCSEACDTTAKTKLRLPDTAIPADISKGHLEPGEPRRLIVRLNDAATDTLQEHPNSSRLRVIVKAESSSTGERVQAVKNFRFRTS